MFFFSDKTMIVTSHKVYCEKDGRPASRIIEFEGTYTIEQGDFVEGVIKSSNGYTLTTDEEGFEIENDGIYTLQDNKKVPEPSEPTESNKH